MAKKKVSQQQEEVVEAMENPTERIANLKSLNALLVKETFERREQMDALVKSKEKLESEVAQAVVEKQRLEAEKRLFEEQTTVAKVQQGLTLVFVTEQVNQQVERLKSEMRREKEELRAQVERKFREINQVSEDFRTYRESVRKELDLKENEIGHLKTVVVDLERGNVEARDEIQRIRNERDGVVEENGDLKRSFEDLKREMVEVVQQRGEIEQEKMGRDLQIIELENAVALLNADLGCKREAMESVTFERDQIKKHLEVQMQESKGLKSKLLEQEKAHLVIQEELGQLQTELQELLEDRKGRERAIESLGKDKMSLERNLVQALKLIEDLRSEIRVVGKEKEDIEAERAKQVIGITGLQKEVDQLGATISALKEEEEGLRLKVYELGKSNAEALEKQEHLWLDFGTLVEEKRETERHLILLMEEKDSTTRRLEEVLLQLEDQKRRVDAIVSEKAEIEQVRTKREVELLELHKEIGGLQDSVSTLQESCKDHVETNKQLQSEAKYYRDAFESAILEKDVIQKELDLKRKEESSLRSYVLELEKTIEEKQKELAQLRVGHSHLLDEKKGINSRIDLLMEEKSSLQMSLSETEEDLKNLRVKVKSYELYAERIFHLLKNTTKILCAPEEAVQDGNGGSVVDADNIDEKFKLVATELEAVKRNFMSKEVKVEEMERELEFLKNSLVQAHKKKSFWTWLSSATTILAAASLAYVSRVR